jgi:hypothetical protein
MRQQHFSLTITPSFDIQISKVHISQFLIISLYVHMISYIKMKVCMYVCVYVRRPAAGPTHAITPKFGMGSSFHPG